MSAVKRSALGKLSRRERAKATHWRVVKAAYTLFCERGYAGTTMAQIAEAAGVAVQTVYFTFHTKAALLSRAYDFAVMGEDEPLVPQKQPWYEAMTAEPNVTEALRHFITGVGEITRRVTPLYLVARAAADGDPDTARVMAFHERWRADGYREVLVLLRAKAELRPGLSLERATDLLLLLAGMDVYYVLVGSRGWSHEEWVDWTVSTVAEQVFGRSGGSP
ncbi:MAG TPA: helix-turn-helix domain-containing protein [Candidatus Limnocylindrales bacterium]|jgi:AcrR family transcriptional regulator|nr:helix-turn-helix domain-containing protein [Candidatus Limnocylindrales bacterium]